MPLRNRSRLNSGSTKQVSTWLINAQATFADIITGLVAHWKMNDDTTSTDVVDNIGGYNGTAQQNTNLLATSKINSALSFNGSSDYVTSNFDFSRKTALTVSAWVKRTGTSAATDFVINQPNSAGSNWFFGIWLLPDSSSNGVYIIAETTSGYEQTQFSGVSVPIDSQWHHVVVTYDGASAICYVDNVASSPVSMTGTMMTSTGQSTIGGSPDSYTGYNYLTGDLDDVRVYSTALSSGDVTSLYNSGAGTESEAGALGTNLVAHYKMNDDAASTTVVDSKGNNGTAQQDTNLLATSKINSALSFNGSSDYVTITGYKGVTGNNPVTVSFWMNADADVSTYPMPYFWGWDGTLYGGNYLIFYADGYLHYANVNPGGDITSLSPLNDNIWHYITTVFDGSMSYLYVDTVLQGTLAHTLDVQSVNDVKIGTYAGSDPGYPGNGRYNFNGKLDDFRIYNRALGSADVAALYNGGLGTEVD